MDQGKKEHIRAARRASLRYVEDGMAGYTRRRRGKGFSYHDEEGRTIRDEELRERLEALAIPPA